MSNRYDKTSVVAPFITWNTQPLTALDFVMPCQIGSQWRKKFRGHWDGYSQSGRVCGFEINSTTVSTAAGTGQFDIEGQFPATLLLLFF
jgi:hypothetical protein